MSPEWLTVDLAALTLIGGLIGVVIRIAFKAIIIMRDCTTEIKNIHEYMIKKDEEDKNQTKNIIDHGNKIACLEVNVKTLKEDIDKVGTRLDDHIAV